MTGLAQIAAICLVNDAIAGVCETLHLGRMKKLRSFLEVIVATAEQKAEAASSRRHPVPGNEKPRDVILGACETIAAELEGDGFILRKSGPKLTQADGDLTFGILVQSDRNNFAGGRAAIWIHGVVHSATLGKWRRANPIPWGGREGPDAGMIAGSQIGNLTSQPAWLEWDFADPSVRSSEIADAVATIRRIMLPFFDLFADPRRAVDVLLPKPGLRQSMLLEYAVAVLGRQAAEDVGRSLLDSDPDLRRSFEGFVTQYRAHGLPRFIGNHASELAAVAVAAGLDLSVRA